MRFIIAQVAALCSAMLLVIYAERSRLLENYEQFGAERFWWLIRFHPDATIYAILFLALPVCLLLRKPLFVLPDRLRAAIDDWFGSSTKPTGSKAGQSLSEAWLLSGGVALASLFTSGFVAQMEVGQEVKYRFGQLPPAYHDEYSYLFQAETFLAGKLAFESHPETAELFDQVHVLNEGRFASRYFPVPGVVIAPFLALGHPYWGHWLAGAFAAFFFFWTGRELAGNGVGFLCGLLMAFSPGIALFSNLLLAHHPTLAALSLFLYFVVRLMRSESRIDAVLAGFGLTAGMLARPMTAAGIGLPFGIWLLYYVIKVRPNANRRQFNNRLTNMLLVGSPVLLGLLFLLFYNYQLTDNWLTTPYQQYTDIYTPRHVYGFNNVIRGEQQLGPKVLDNYDRWAVNLTPSLALQNVQNRMLASWQWTLDIIPLLIVSILFPILTPREDQRWWLIPGAILSLHLVHVPYWYDGIMHWHYVFESAPFWLLLTAGVFVQLIREWNARNRSWMSLWYSGILVAAMLPNWVACEPFWFVSNVRQGVDNIAFSRMKYQQFDETIDRVVTERPALVLVKPDPDDRHIDYVTNAPGLSGELLFGRYLPQRYSLAELRAQFPERSIYLVDVRAQTVRKL